MVKNPVYMELDGHSARSNNKELARFTVVCFDE
jgi:hypothetical protein